MLSRLRSSSLKNLQLFYWLITEILTFFWLIKIPGGTQKTVAFGFSLSRIILLLIPASLIVITLILFLNWFNSQDLFTKLIRFFTRKPRGLMSVLWFLFLISALTFYLIFFPEYRLGKYLAYWQRLRPIFFCFFSISFETLLFANRKKLFSPGKFKGFLRQEKDSLRFIGKTCVLILLAVLFVVLTRIGLVPDDFSWTVAAAPILIEQLYWAFVIYILLVSGLNILQIRFVKDSKWLDPLVFMIIWGIGSLIWVSQPVTWSGYLQEPAAPNYEYYPESDAAMYVSGARNAVLGEGIHGGEKTDKPLYIAFLSGLIMLSDGSYLALASLQTIVLALSAGFIYLLGKELYKRDFGLLLAVFCIIYEGNANLVTGHVTAMYSKLFMSEPFMSLFLVITLYFAVRWIKSLEIKYFYLMAGFSGLAVLIRPHALFVFASLMIYSIVPFTKKIKLWVSQYLPGVLVLISAILPWMITCKLHHGYFPFLYKFERVLDKRYSFDLSPRPFLPGSANTYLPLGSYIIDNLSTIFSQIGWVTAHFVNNLFKSFLIFPLSFRFDNLLTTIQKPYWSIVETQTWVPEVNLIFFLHLFVMVLGLLSLWKKNRYAAFLPLIVFISYLMANAFGLTSGGRHLYPVIWNVVLYYLSGCYFLLQKVLHLFFASTPLLLPEAAGSGSVRKSGSFIFLKISALFLLAGCYLPSIDSGILIPQAEKQTAIQEKLNIYLAENELPETLQGLIEINKARILPGQVWYPFQPAGEKSITFRTSASEIRQEDPKKLELLIDPDIDIDYFPDRSAAAVVQCGVQNTKDITVIAIIFLDTDSPVEYWNLSALANCH